MRQTYQILSLLSLLMAFAVIFLSFALWGDEWALFPILPSIYFFIGALLLSVTWSTGPSPFLAISLPVAFLRYVAFPALATINGGYQGRSLIPPTVSSFQSATVLMAYELLVVGFLIAYLEWKYHRMSSRIAKPASRALPFWFIFLLALIVALLIARSPFALVMVNFLRPTILMDTSNFSTGLTFIAMLVISVKVFIVVGLMHRLAASTRWQIIAPWLAALLCVLNVSVFFGTNRITVVLTAVASVWVFRQLFGARAWGPSGLIVVAALLVFTVITDERDYRFEQTSRLVNLADSIQTYTGGVYNVAIGMEIPESYPEASSFSVLAFDFIRPTIGLNLLAKNWDILYSNIYFNYRMWTHVDRRSQIIPMIAQGYLFFPVVLAPILSVFFVFLAYTFLKLLPTVPYVELRYGMVLIILRCGFFWGNNSMNIMNFLSLQLIIPLALVSVYMALHRVSLRRD